MTQIMKICQMTVIMIKCPPNMPMIMSLYLSHISVFALVFCALLCWNLPSLSNYANLCRYHLRHYMCHLIEVPYFLPFCTIRFCIGHLCYLYSHHICPLFCLVLLKLQLVQQWYAVVLPGAYLDLGLIYGALNLANTSRRLALKEGTKPNTNIRTQRQKVPDDEDIDINKIA